DFAVIKGRKLVSHKNEKLRALAIKVLAQGELTEDIAQVLAGVLKAERVIDLRSVALEAFTKHRARSLPVKLAQRARAVFMDVLSDQAQSLREEAFAALKRLDITPSFEVPLLGLLEPKRSLEARRYVAAVLVKLGPELGPEDAKKAVSALASALGDLDADVQ